MLFTDGLVEGFDGLVRGRRLGEDALYALLGDLLDQALDTEALCDSVLEEVRARNGGELTDDVAVVVVSWAER
jgi:hypothetical protein